jgi:hypothetical protein
MGRKERKEVCREGHMGIHEIGGMEIYELKIIELPRLSELKMWILLLLLLLWILLLWILLLLLLLWILLLISYSVF